jgi:16S rRNA (cytidine1402-2'-O)-methyltransferase
MATLALGSVYLIPCYLDEGHMEVLPAYLLDAIRDCQVFFVENERTARRYLKKWWREMEIDAYEWVTIHKAEAEVCHLFKSALQAGKNIGILSEAGCPGIADPGQVLVSLAQQLQATVKPLVGPSSILLAMMASGMNGQSFTFHGYLPVDANAREKRIQQLEAQSAKDQSAHIFIETPYRNQAFLLSLLKACKPHSRLCIAVDITGDREQIRTRSMAQWQQQPIDLHKRPAIFILQA